MRTFEGMDNSVMEIKASFFRFLLSCFSFTSFLDFIDYFSS